MVLQKRLDYGFNGYQMPPTPRAARSARRRCSFRKKVDDNPMCAFDLLATVAGNLLLEGESSPSSSNTLPAKKQCAAAKDFVKKEQQKVVNPLKVEPCDQGSFDRSSIASELVPQDPVLNHSFTESPNAQRDAFSGLASVVTTSDCPEKAVSAEKLVNGKSKVELGTFATKVKVGSTGHREAYNCTVEDDNKKQMKIEPPNTGNVSVSNSTRPDMCMSEGKVIWNRKPSNVICLDNSVKLPLCRDDILCGSFPVCRDDVNLVIRDDDENSSGCTQPSTTAKAFRPPLRIGDRKIRKLLASKYWKVTPKLKDERQLYTGAERKPAYRNRKNCYKRQRSQRDYPFKKRKLFDCSSVSNSDGGISSEGISSLPGKGFSGDASDSGAAMNGATGTPASAASQHTSFQSKDSHVKLRIKSFKVPELFIEIPETATVGSLKRTVMEAVTAILGGGLRIGVLLQGKKIRDDNKTLQQTGISHDNKLDALGFTLEPNPSQTPTPLCPNDLSFLPPCDAPQPLTRYPPAPNVVRSVVKEGNYDAPLDPPVANFGNFIESDHDSAPSPPAMSIDKSTTDSRALVAVPAMNVEALTVVPMRKSKRSEVAQRRIRRPFSVSEVEALVQAVEKLGTGRWRDVKLRAFDNAKHRTYVDLKDKWKTLVHTARISPQQRRGEPVPQELLDRVLAAHAYWSQNQAKQQLKQQQYETCLLV
ncbi:telomere repeat-binding protein 5-like isoform X2 [Cornus florida]|uniref:telomere repeat-binding protein 5-like isoform X2 n=1 Tax=Cornus florida TaxID=4283 RepID=UPI0028998833|nr:telomere repeat-binding protein 5-like isoform X2 [Cornus florida]